MHVSLLEWWWLYMDGHVWFSRPEQHNDLYTIFAARDEEQQ